VEQCKQAQQQRQALGLMQVRKVAADDVGMNWSGLVSPQLNILCGTRYLAKLISYYGGDIKNALAAYNWGMGYFDRVNKDLTKAPLSTQNYVRIILGTYKSLQGMR
jgi:soluble lytic murein transglycosylase-like protein